MNKDLQTHLLALKQNDDEARARLVAAGVLYQGYNKEMASVHIHNAEQLETIINRYGWPGIALVGEEGAGAAFLIVHHAISRPALQRQCLELIRASVRSGDVEARHEALLMDRISFNERRPYRISGYGRRAPGESRINVVRRSDMQSPRIMPLGGSRCIRRLFRTTKRNRGLVPRRRMAVS